MWCLEIDLLPSFIWYEKFSFLLELLNLIMVLDGKFTFSVLIIFNFVAAEKIKYGLLKTNNKLFFLQQKFNESFTQ